MTHIQRHYSEDPTARGDEQAEELRRWYEEHRETWWDRHPMSRNQQLLRAGTADNFMLALISEARKILIESGEVKPVYRPPYRPVYRVPYRREVA